MKKNYEELCINFEKDDFEQIQRKASKLNIIFKKLILENNPQELHKLIQQTAGTMYSGAILSDKFNENELTMHIAELRYINGFMTVDYMLSGTIVERHLLKEQKTKSIQ